MLDKTWIYSWEHVHVPEVVQQECLALEGLDSRPDNNIIFAQLLGLY